MSTTLGGDAENSSDHTQPTRPLTLLGIIDAFDLPHVVAGDVEVLEVGDGRQVVRGALKRKRSRYVTKSDLMTRYRLRGGDALLPASVSSRR